MNESEQIERLESEIRDLEYECEMWRKTSNQLNETLNKLITTFIFNTDKAWLSKSALFSYKGYFFTVF